MLSAAWRAIAIRLHMFGASGVYSAVDMASQIGQWIAQDFRVDDDRRLGERRDFDRSSLGDLSGARGYPGAGWLFQREVACRAIRSLHACPSTRSPMKT